MGFFRITLQEWFSCGSWGVSNHEFKFRHENRRFRLIGFDQSSHMRNSGDATFSSTNFLTGKQKFITENMFDPEVPVETKWQKLDGQRVYFLDEMTAECRVNKQGHDWCR